MLNFNAVNQSDISHAAVYPNTSHKKLRVAAYCRVSTNNEDQVNSYDSQVKYFTDYIQQHPEWHFCGIYADEGITGTSTKKRVNFNRMISDAQNGLVDLILTKEVSRFARNTVDTLSITRSLKKQGVYVIFTNDNINTKDNDGELRLSIMATIAQDESRKTSERVKWGQKRRMEQGVVFGRDMIGYTVKNGKLYLNEEEAEIVKLIFHKFTDEGKGTHVIARELREAGIAPKRVKEWSNTVILRLLRNEKYVGDLCQKKTYTPDFLDHAKKYNRGVEEKVYIRDHHSDIAIIDRDLWDRTQAELDRRSISAEMKSKHSNRYWCSGKLICGECGSRFVSRTKHLKNGTLYKAWRCYASAMHGGPKIDQHGNHFGCIGKSISDKALRMLIVYAINLVVQDKDRIKRELKDQINDIIMETPKMYDKAKIQQEIDAIQKKKIRLIDLAAQDVISNADVKVQNDLYNEQLNLLSKKIIEAENLSIARNRQTKQIEQYIERIDSIMSCTYENDAVLREVLDHAIIYANNSVDLYLNCVPFGIKLCYTTTGKMDSFKVDVTSFTVISDVQ